MIVRLKVTGMQCAACSARVESVVSGLAGVSNVEVNLLTGDLKAEIDDGIKIEFIIAAIRSAGYDAFSKDGEKSRDTSADDQKKLRLRIIISAVALLALMYFSMGHMVGLPVPLWYAAAENSILAGLLQFFLSAIVIALNADYFQKGFRALFHRAPNMDTLIAVGSGAAFIYSVFALIRMIPAMQQADMETVLHYRHSFHFESAAMILTLITVGKYLEARAKGKTGDAIRQLIALRPETAVVLRNGAETVVPIDAVCVGDVVVVRSGGHIPVDGVVIEGRGAVDQSAITGESVPVEVSVGSKVVAATINTEGYLRIRAQMIGEDTTLAQVIRMVEQASGSKAPIARLADKIAGIFVPTVMCIACVTFVIWLLCGQSIIFALDMAISVLVISCPCALGLATPVAIMVSTGRAAQMGILFRTAQSLEMLHRVDTVVLDKTGTLSVGKPSVTDICAASTDEKTLLQLAAGLECYSEHLFARAIMEKQGVEPFTAAEQFQTIPGKGVSGSINGVIYYGGNSRLMEELGICVPSFDSERKKGKTPLYFAAESGQYLGAILAADVLKEDSSAAVAQLKGLGLRVIMLTGDNATTSAAIAADAGIEDVISDVLPAQKEQAIRTLQAEGYHVLMVGDGINDAPALVRADVGMAIGAGTDIAVEAADVVLTGGSLTGIVDAIAISKATIRNIRQNLFWAFFYNSLGIPIAAGVLYPAFGIALSPMLGAAAMSISSLFVVTNALRLRLFKTRKSPVLLHTDKMEEVSMEHIIYAEGMMCTHCKARVEGICKQAPGCTDAVVDLQEKRVTIYGEVDLEAIKKAIEEAGYPIIK